MLIISTLSAIEVVSPAAGRKKIPSFQISLALILSSSGVSGALAIRHNMGHVRRLALLKVVIESSLTILEESSCLL